MNAVAEYYVIGVYEDFTLEVFPTHVSPIIAERGEYGYRRWHYMIVKPYCIRPVEPIGKYSIEPETLFPVVTYHLCPPKKLFANSQIIAISKNEILVEKNKAIIIFRLIRAILCNIKDSAYRKRAWRTISNSWL